MYAVLTIMTQRRHHYEASFEEYLRARRIPYVAVDEARKALLPEARLTYRDAAVPGEDGGDDGAGGRALKSFDFVLYGQGSNLLVEVKGRRLGVSPNDEGGNEGGDEVGNDIAARTLRPTRRSTRRSARRMECWVTLDDVDSLLRWESLFGDGFEAVFVFVYWCESQPPDALFQEIFEHRGRWYAVRAVRVRDYQRAMRVRSPRWGTVHLTPPTFEQLSAPLSGPTPFGLPDPPSLGLSFLHPTRRNGAELPTLDRLVPA